MVHPPRFADRKNHREGQRQPNVKNDGETNSRRGNWGKKKKAMKGLMGRHNF
jgi:hypothetical protein